MTDQSQSRSDGLDPDERAELEAHRLIMRWTFCSVLNANDFYGYACADATQIDDVGFDALLRLAKEYGNDGIKAAMACASNCEPIKPHQTDKYRAAKASITEEERKALAEEESCSDWAEVNAKLKKAEEQLAAFRSELGRNEVQDLKVTVNYLASANSLLTGRSVEAILKEAEDHQWP